MAQEVDFLLIFRQSFANMIRWTRRTFMPFMVTASFAFYITISLLSPPSRLADSKIGEPFHPAEPHSHERLPSNQRRSKDQNTGEKIGLFRYYLDKNGSHQYSAEFRENTVCHVWPSQLPNSDRIENQLLYKPKKNLLRKKNILVYGINQPIYRRPPIGQAIFIKNKCPVNTCKINYDVKTAKEADLVWFQESINPYFTTNYDRPRNQIWMMSILESPLHTIEYKSMEGVNGINWTATYRHDSEFVTPYGKYALYDPAVKALPQTTNFAKLKAKAPNPGKIAMFVSNCNTGNKRLEYAKELSKYISLDIFGACGPNRCDKLRAHKCREILRRDYKFFLAFENSNCRWYITEKLWNALDSDVLPIVMGAPLEHYKAVAPHHSFIHVDQFEGPKALGDYLIYLDKNATAYNEYFAWKGTGELIDTKLYCRICALLHSDNIPQKTYSDFANWWQGPDVCKGPARDFTPPIIFDF